MSLMDFLFGPDINKEIEKCRNTPGAVLLDVREPNEYAQGHIPGSQNVPMNKLGKIEWFVPRKDTPVFIYCLAGTRSKKAAAVLISRGYTNVRSIGGINRYKGRIV